MRVGGVRCRGGDGSEHDEKWPRSTDPFQEATKGQPRAMAEQSPALRGPCPTGPCGAAGATSGLCSGLPSMGNVACQSGNLGQNANSRRMCVGTVRKSPKRIPRRDRVYLKNCLMDPWIRNCTSREVSPRGRVVGSLCPWLGRAYSTCETIMGCSPWANDDLVENFKTLGQTDRRGRRRRVPRQAPGGQVSLERLVKAIMGQQRSECLPSLLGLCQSLSAPQHVLLLPKPPPVLGMTRSIRFWASPHTNWVLLRSVLVLDMSHCTIWDMSYMVSYVSSFRSWWWLILLPCPTAVSH